MKRMILTSMLTAVGLLAQGTGAQSGSAPVTPNSKAPAAATQTKVKKHKKSTKKDATVKPAAAVKPAAKTAKPDASKALVQK